jgi:hypothetical protein
LTFDNRVPHKGSISVGDVTVSYHKYGTGPWKFRINDREIMYHYSAELNEISFYPWFIHTYVKSVSRSSDISVDEITHLLRLLVEEKLLNETSLGVTGRLIYYTLRNPISNYFSK